MTRRGDSSIERRLALAISPSGRLRLVENPDAPALEHVPATLYGGGARLDVERELFLRLRRVDQLDLLTAASSGAVLAAQGGGARKRITETALTEVFGIELNDSSYD